MIRAGVNAGGGGAVDILDEVGIVVALGEGVVAVAVVGIVLIVETGGAAAAGANENELPIFDGAEVVPGSLRDVSLPRGDIEAEKALCVRLRLESGS